MTKRFLSLFLLFSALLVTSISQAVPVLVIQQAWVQEGPPNTRVLAGYMKLQNMSEEPILITAAESEQFAKVEFHRSVHSDGITLMVKQQTLTIDPGNSLILKPGSFHLMLMGPKYSLKAGDWVEVSLTLADKTVIPLSMQVQKPEQAVDHSHHQH
jgi:copper(I)-binding protein